MILAKKSFGQHFLRDSSVVERIVKAAGASSDDVIVEIGPGEGVLTEGLVRSGASLMLVEADRDLIHSLEERFPGAHIVLADAARIYFGELVGNRSWVLIGNLPYNAAAAILANAIESDRPPKRMVVMVQAEQADRIAAKPGETSLLSVVVQLSYDVKKLFNVSPGAFSPRPKVDSTVLELTLRRDAPDLDTFRKIIALAKIGFSSRRKQLHKNLASAGIADSERIKTALVHMGLTSAARAQELSMEQWKTLSTILA